MTASSSERPVSRHAKLRVRTRQILKTLARHGFGYLLETPQRHKNANASVTLSSAPEMSSAGQPGRWNRVRLLLEDLGPTFIKMGQIFSNRPDLIPEDLLTELKKLQDSVPPFPFEAVKATIETELEGPLESFFRDFQKEPVASASVAQVHAATLFNGKKVAVKVLRPGVEELVGLDLEILTHLGSWLENLIFRGDVLDAKAILEEFSRTMLKETDLRNEALYQGKFAANFQDHSDIFVPRVVSELSRRRLLVMDFVQGIHPLDWEGYDKAGLKRHDVAKKGVELLLTQVFVHGFFHADPHVGNLRILPDGRIVFLDFGMMGILFSKHREYLAEMLAALAVNDPTLLTRALLKLAGKPLLDQPQKLEEEIFILLETYAHLPLKEVDLKDFLQRVVAILLKFRLVLPPGMYLLMKSLVTIEGFGRQLNPDFQLLDQLEPFVRKVFAEKFEPQNLFKGAVDSLGDYVSFLGSLPEDLQETLQHWKKGKVQLEWDHADLENILHKADRISNRLSFALIVTGVILASALTFQSHIPPLWNGIPVLSILGLLGSGILGFALLISIWRSGRF